MKFSDSVLYEDNHILALNKPKGLLTQPSGTEQESLEDFAKAWIKEKYQKPGQVFLHAVHRLDKPVSGIVLFAKTSKALSRLNEALRSKQCEKVYYAWVEGDISHDGVWEDHLVHADYKAEADETGKKARLAYHVKERKGVQTLLEIMLETGRYHQIRAQCSLRGYPIVGDTKYGSHVLIPKGILLHHGHLTFPHPITKERIVVEAIKEVQYD